MPGYSLIVMLHVVAGVVALAGFWAAALMKKGSPRHRLLGKVYLGAMAAIVVTAVPITVQFAFFRHQPLTALFLAYLIAITGNASWLAWRAVTDKRDWKRMVARVGWKLALWPMVLLAGAVLVVGVQRGQMLFLGFSVIGLWAGWRMWNFSRRGPGRPDWAFRQHYQSMLGAGIATHVAFLSIGMRPVWQWLQSHTRVPPLLIELFPWAAPVLVAVLIGYGLNRKYGGRRGARPTPSPRMQSPAE
ncbi:hypothetical protein [Stenotrophomonas sp. ATCM1_4]|nr:hypothetical protein [Stenotrophomonas sp. ATCM1_4]